jgi:hypothetical protein
VADGSVRIPREVAEPHLWQQTYGASPNGPVLMVFPTGHSLNMETATVLIGQDGSYRVMYMAPGEEFGSLSPDGKYVLRQGLLDLATGRTRYMTPAYAQWTWSADGGSAVAAIDRNGPETYYPDGTSDDGIRPDDVTVLDVATGRTHTVYHGDADELRAAFSPDGKQIAITVGRELKPQRLLLLDAADGKVSREIALNDRQRLAGPAAWSPDGRTVLLTYGELCTNTDFTCAEQRFHLQRVDVATGTVTDEAQRARAGTADIVAWRDGQPIATWSTSLDCDIVQLTDRGKTTLHDDCPTIPRDLMERAAWDGPPLTAPVWQAQWWFFAGIGLFSAVVIALAVRLRTGRTRRTTRP